MSDFRAFMKKNKLVRENAFYPASEDLKDENGQPLRWEIRALTTRVVDAVRAACTRETPTGQGGYRQIVDPSFTARLCAAAVVSPDLENAELQDSYGVKTPHELLVEMLDNPAEFNALAAFIQEHSGLNRSLAKEVNEAKN